LLRFRLRILIALLFFVVFWPAGGPADQAQVLPVLNSSLGQRRSLSLVVYNNDLALVRERRQVKRSAGRFVLHFTDVAKKIIPSSVVVESSAGLKILEQQYNYDILSKRKLLESYLGRQVTLERLDKRTNTTERVSGVLLSLNGGTIIQFEDRVEVDPEGRFILPEVPGNLLIRPSLTWLVESEAGDSCLLDVSYLTTGISWSCAYVLSLQPESDKANLSGWVSIHNNSGASYEQVELNLVAGRLHRVSGPSVARTQLARATASSPRPTAEVMGGSFEQEAGFEYYRYKLGRITSLPDKEIKQVELFRLDGLKLKKIYRFEGGERLFYSPAAQQSRPVQVSVRLEWVNTGENYPGMPLPAGVVRLYEQEPQGAAYFLGEDRIGHTPKEEKISLLAGQAFDLLAERKQTEYKKLSDRLRRVSIQITLTNRKGEDVIIEVDETLPGDWKITRFSHPYKKLDARKVRFSPRVEAGGKTVLSYTVEFL